MISTKFQNFKLSWFWLFFRISGLYQISGCRLHFCILTKFQDFHQISGFWPNFGIFSGFLRARRSPASALPGWCLWRQVLCSLSARIFTGFTIESLLQTVYTLVQIDITPTPRPLLNGNWPSLRVMQNILSFRVFQLRQYVLWKHCQRHNGPRVLSL